MRKVRGEVLIPPEAAGSAAGLLLVEARDVSLMDAPSVVVAESRTTVSAPEPGGRFGFELDVPDAEPGHTIALRAHLSRDGTPAVSEGDAISVTHLPVPAEGDVDGVEVPTRIV